MPPAEASAPALPRHPHRYRQYLPLANPARAHPRHPRQPRRTFPNHRLLSKQTPTFPPRHSMPVWLRRFLAKMGVWLPRSSQKWVSGCRDPRKNGCLVAASGCRDPGCRDPSLAKMGVWLPRSWLPRSFARKNGCLVAAILAKMGVWLPRSSQKWVISPCQCLPPHLQPSACPVLVLECVRAHWRATMFFNPPPAEITAQKYLLHTIDL